MWGFRGLKSPSISTLFSTTLSALAAYAALVGCAPKLDEDTVETVYQCELPVEQSKTLSGRWPKLIIPVSFKQGDFSSGELAKMIDALDAWNTHFQKTQSLMVFDYGSRGSPRMTPNAAPASLCSYSLLNGSNQFVSAVAIYKRSTWPYPTAKDAVGLTSSCSKSASPVPSMYISIIELNYQYFFVSGTRQPDLTSILLHELGHLLGVDHSCVASTSTKASGGGYPICDSSDLKQEYYDAVMFPTVFFNSDGTGQVRSLLQTNDQGRANCLYGNTAI